MADKMADKFLSATLDLIYRPISLPLSYLLLFYMVADKRQKLISPYRPSPLPLLGDTHTPTPYGRGTSPPGFVCHRLITINF